MKPLWAPWRIDYILGDKSSGCIFCDKVKESADRDNGILLRGEHAFVMLNAYPYNPAHVMISPYAHVDCLEKVQPLALAEIMALTRLSEMAVREAVRPEGFNMGLNIGRAAGAGIEEHLHLHLLPRWNGDVNFMPAVAGTHVIPEALLQTYDKLLPAFTRLANQS
ncbi:MAG: HIT domain-containing protein [Nitrospirota bacterium]|nr:HIT domain-containing protein [Nitrospirota bacterium]